MNGRLTVALVVMGCSASPSLAATEDGAVGGKLDLPGGLDVAAPQDTVVLAPRDVWKAGQRWRSLYMHRSIRLPSWTETQDEHILEYEVVAASVDGATIRVAEPEPIKSPNPACPLQAELEFGATGERVGVLDHRRMFGPEQSADPLGWPKFPLRATGSVPRPTADGPTVQHVRRDGNLFTITLESVRTDPDGEQWARIQIQWEAGRPWWDRAYVTHHRPGLPDAVSGHQTTLVWYDDLEDAEN
jgi:hypothetical protein